MRKQIVSRPRQFVVVGGRLIPTQIKPPPALQPIEPRVVVRPSTPADVAQRLAEAVGLLEQAMSRLGEVRDVEQAAELADEVAQALVEVREHLDAARRDSALRAFLDERLQAALRRLAARRGVAWQT